MRSRSVKYPLFLLYELFRLWTLLQQGAANAIAPLPVSWYAAVPLLCIVPAILFLITFDPDARKEMLYLVAAIKGFGLPGLVLYIVKNLTDAIRFGAAADFTLLGAILSAALFIILDTVISLICLRDARAETLCK